MFLGAPLAAAACGSSPRRNFVPDGEIVGQSVAVGHRIREFSSHLPQPEKYEEKSIVIVGAGVAGLSAARYLKRQNIHDFIIVELEREPGGTARSGSSKLAG